MVKYAYNIMDRVTNIAWKTTSGESLGSFGYEYDAAGQMFACDDCWQVIADVDEQGNVIASYTWGDGIDNLLAVKVGGESYYPLTDIQGTVWGYVDSQNNVVARWLSKDPIRLLGGINLYAFCGNSPILHVDPYGDDFYSVIDTVSDFCAGFGDTILFGVTKK